MKSSPNANVFCNTPWYEAHIYWDGSLGVCCQESRKLSNDPKYNIQTMSLIEWFNSDPVKEFRLGMLGSSKLTECSQCYHDEQYSGTSRRHRSNQKSVIFTKQAFAESFEQSPGNDHFNKTLRFNGATDTLPIDLHVDLGNHCNLACKMCWPGASTSIATQYVKWGIDAQEYLGVDWTKNPTVWRRFLNDLLLIPKLKNIHFMGGETMLSPKLEQLVDFLIDNHRLDINLSFVTNGTVYNPQLMEKLKQFPRVGLEISIETTTQHNDYIRQGSKVDDVINTIKQYIKICKGTSIDLTLRPAISALSIGYYHTLLKFCLDEQLLIKSMTVTNPSYMSPLVLPKSVRMQYAQYYTALLGLLDDVDINLDYNESDSHNYQKVIKSQIKQVLALLHDDTPIPSNLLADLFAHCKKWDEVYTFDINALYPEFKELYETV